MLTCQRAVSAYVYMSQSVLCTFTCSHTNMLCVLSCSRGNVPWVYWYLTCNHVCHAYDSRVNVACELTCSRANILCIPSLTRLAWLRDHLPTCFPSSVSIFKAFFSVSLPLLFKLYTLLIKFKSLINVFPQ